MDAITINSRNTGLVIAQSKESQVSHVEENFYVVKSQSGKGEVRDREKVRRGLKRMKLLC